MYFPLDANTSTEATGVTPSGESGGVSVTEMVALARSGDAKGFTSLFQTYNAQVCTYLARLVGSDELGRDLAQETFLRAWKSLPGIQDELHFKPWLYRIATNVARSHLRHERLIRWLPWIEHGDNWDTVEGASERLSIAGPEERVSEMECVEQAMARVAPQCRTCLLLQVVAGFSQREVAQLLGISEKSVGAYVSRGREQFRKAYRQLKGESQS